MSALGIEIGDPHAEVAEPNTRWLALGQLGRIHQCNAIVKSMGALVIAAPDNGFIEVKLAEDFSAKARGSLLQYVERKLRAEFGGIVVHVRPLQDKNRLRVLRGVEVK